jgi:mRNA-degrading endonuclease RelE of RelBE toxin-antitoxin system
MAARIDWSEGARYDIRALDKPTAMLVFDGILRYAQTGVGDVKALHGGFEGRLRLRVGDFRIFFTPVGDTLRIHAVANRKDAYRG